jgi:hypothetical protein
MHIYIICLFVLLYFKLCGSLFASWKHAARTDPATAARKTTYSSPQTADAGQTELADGVSEMGGVC